MELLNLTFMAIVLTIISLFVSSCDTMTIKQEDEKEIVVPKTIYNRNWHRQAFSSDVYFRINTVGTYVGFTPGGLHIEGEYKEDFYGYITLDQRGCDNYSDNIYLFVIVEGKMLGLSNDVCKRHLFLTGTFEEIDSFPNID